MVLVGNLYFPFIENWSYEKDCPPDLYYYYNSGNKAPKERKKVQKFHEELCRHLKTTNTLWRFSSELQKYCSDDVR